MSNAALEILNRHGAILRNGHFVGTRGRHLREYVNKDVIYPHVRSTSRLCRIMASHFEDVDVVVGPAVGGVILSQRTAEHLGDDVLAIYAEKDGDSFCLRRGYGALVRNRNVLVVEDVLTTGGSLAGVIQEVRNHGGFVTGAAVLVAREGVTAEQVGGPPTLVSLIQLDFQSYPEDDCPMCQEGIPINTDVGWGREFMDQVELERRIDQEI